MLIVITACSEKDASKNLLIVGQNGNTVAYNVELAQTPSQMRIGLMNRPSLAPQSGMIFDLSNVDVPTAMWMKDTKIPLDMIFIDKDGSIYWIYENAQPESTQLIVAPYPATAVLEVNGGDVAKYGIKIGDTVQHVILNKAEFAEGSVPAETEIGKVKEEIKDTLAADAAATATEAAPATEEQEAAPAEKTTTAEEPAASVEKPAVSAQSDTEATITK